VEDSCEYGNEPSRYIKCWEVLEKLHDWQLCLIIIIIII
jgi:hypothetical protein